MKLTKTVVLYIFFLLFLTLFLQPLSAQMITGVWRGKINKKKVELKIIQKGDSLAGTSYYYESPSVYRRYSIKGYFDSKSNNAIWWDDQLLEEHLGRGLANPGKIPYLSSADFNCPGSDEMYLEGTSAEAEDPDDKKGPVDLQKVPTTQFEDEWDFVIENYTFGTNDPYIIDSVALIASERRRPEVVVPPIIYNEPVLNTPVNEKATSSSPVINEPPAERKLADRQTTIENKFTTRQKILTKEIPLSGDSITLHFYDNAEIDGDSISLFLNDRLLFEHIRLTGNPYTIKLPVNELKEVNELIMVAENLGSIPPNTSYMIAIVDEKRYDAQLASSEKSSAMIRLVKSVLNQQ